ncbi:ammonia monooxygenase [Nocardioides marmoriginsengisoli]|uniref:Ammonia monooxygenase n=1 Tax=Nocardioides marmoriginsengisoli TaxID=661483 RepID=A0A3N0CT99_9ACTN|nr:DUF6527 family protein [Nocardioides marmoriginsengisoli]RNL66226.1 ammonia monooxygenase [Nocardioides marmoriginsengisoli]
MVDVAKTATNGTAPGRRVHFRCPGCGTVHGVTVDAPNSWTWNGDLQRPTFEPSVLVHPHRTFVNGDLDGDALTAPENITMTPLCHSFVRGGRIEFLGDCTHGLAGQTVDLPPWRED